MATEDPEDGDSGNTGDDKTGDDKTGDNGTGGSQTVSNFWTFASVLTIVVAVVIITLYTVRHYATSATDAGTILGIVIPVFATMGAAIFGVTVAYQSGSRTGEQTGVKKGKNDAANIVEPEVNSMHDSAERLVRRIEVHGSSRAGEEMLLLGRDNPVEVPNSDLAELRERVERMKGVVRALRSS
jgi:hypothetical protein